MVIKKIVHIWLMIGCMLVQPLWLAAQPFNFTVYREADGLPSGYVQKAFEDSRGYLWLCTFGGLSRFDGRNFKNYDIKDGLPDNFCDEIAEDNKGNLWIGTRQGLCYFDGQKFNRIPHPDSLTTVYFSNFSIDANNRLSCVYNHRNACVLNGKLEYVSLTDDVPGLPVNNYIVQKLADGTKILNSTQGVYSISAENKIQSIFPFHSFVTYFFSISLRRMPFIFLTKRVSIIGSLVN